MSDKATSERHDVDGLSTTASPSPAALPGWLPNGEIRYDPHSGDAFEGYTHHLVGLLSVSVYGDPRGWVVTTSHGEPPRGFYATLLDAQRAGDRHARSQLERTLSLLSAAEDEPRAGGRPRPCGIVLLYPSDDITERRKTVLAALLEVS